MDTSTLPKWAQKHISDLTRDRDIAEADLKKYMDDQTKAPLSQLVNVGSTMQMQKRYVQGRSIDVEWKGVELNMILDKDGICIVYSSTKRRLSGGVALFPQFNNSILIREVDYQR